MFSFDLPLILAQVAPIEPTSTNPLSTIYDIFLNNGLMGAALALLIFLLIRRDSDLQRSQEGRLLDAKNLADLVKDHTTALIANNLANEERNRALEVAARAAEKSAIIIEQLTKQIEDLKITFRGK